MNKTINIMDYKNKKISSDTNSESLNIEDFLIGFNAQKENEEKQYREKLGWFVSLIKKKKRIESNKSILLNQEENKMLFWLSEIMYKYCKENFIDYTINDVDNNIFSQSYILKLEGIFVLLETIYHQDNVTLVCELQLNAGNSYVDIDWIFNNIEHPKKNEFKQQLILSEIERIASFYGLTVEEIKELLK